MPMPTHPHPSAGTPTPLTSYTTCQYEETSPPIREHGPTTHIRCTEAALMMPGYKRACARHILPILRDAIHTLLERPNTPPHTTTQLHAALARLQEPPTP